MRRNKRDKDEGMLMSTIKFLDDITLVSGEMTFQSHWSNVSTGDWSRDKQNQ